MIRVKVWREGSTDRPVLRKLLNEVGELEIAEKLDFVVVMDGDVGRKLHNRKRPLTAPWWRRWLSGFQRRGSPSFYRKSHI